MRTRDFRSDTVTKPSAAMREAMLRAEVGDDVLDGDPTVRELEARAAKWLGKRGALFVPSGTMANQVAIGAWTSPGEELICERGAHVACWESGAAAANHGVQFSCYDSEDGALSAAELERMIRPASEHCPQTTLLSVEQSFLGSGRGPGGVVMPVERLEGMADVCGDYGIRMHLDGARLANAVVRSGIAASEWAGYADSVSICLSKGLGAPVGSIIAGDEDFLARARLVRKRLGGWMRQAGILAAAGLYALEHNVERLAEDHENARFLARGFDALPGVSCPEPTVQTNVVMLRVADTGMTAARLADRLAAEGVGVLPMNDEVLRFVTHMDVDREDCEQACAALARVLGTKSCAPA